MIKEITQSIFLLSSQLSFFYESEINQTCISINAEINDPFLFLSFPLQIIKKSCIEILAAEPSSVCAGGGELKTHTRTHVLTHRHTHTLTQVGLTWVIYTGTSRLSFLQQF